MDRKIKVLMTTEGTYPFHQGGVSTWCDIMVKQLKDIDYVLYSIIMNPFVTQKFTLPENTSLIKLPLWGTEEPSEHLELPFSHYYDLKRKTDDRVINSRFLPLFEELVREIISVDKNPKRFGQLLLEMNQYFNEYEYKASFKSEKVWERYKTIIIDSSRNPEYKLAETNIWSMMQSLGWLYRFFNIVNITLPKVHVSHSAAAAFCGIPCVLAKLRDKTPYLLTEHGVYIREQYLALSQRGYSSFLNTFFIRLVQSINSLNFEYADQISPVCQYNTRWERRFGVGQDRLKVIYNGVDRKVFTPSESTVKNKYPTVVTIARIDPIKDILTLISASALVKEKIPDVRFVIYGSVSVPTYFEECIALKSKLNLDENFIFAGHTNDVPAAYRSADVIALSSISEAFPYSVVEAMMVGKPVVATDVGGIKEALGDCGITVSPRNPGQLAEALVKLLVNPGLRESMGDDARDRALNYFSLENIIGLYYKSYVDLAIGQRAGAQIRIKKRVKSALEIEKAYALLFSGYYEEAIHQFRAYLKRAPASVAAPAVLAEIANIYAAMGEYDKASNEMEKAEMINMLVCKAG